MLPCPFGKKRVPALWAKRQKDNATERDGIAMHCLQIRAERSVSYCGCADAVKTKMDHCFVWRVGLEEGSGEISLQDIMKEDAMQHDGTTDYKICWNPYCTNADAKKGKAGSGIATTCDGCRTETDMRSCIPGVD